MIVTIPIVDNLYVGCFNPTPALSFALPAAMPDPALPPFPAPALPGLAGPRYILAAHRGQVAVRLVRACRALRMQAAAAVSEADAGSVAARHAGRRVAIGPPPLAQSYLTIERRPIRPTTTTPLDRDVLAHEDFAARRVTNGWVEGRFLLLRKAASASTPRTPKETI